MASCLRVYKTDNNINAKLEDFSVPEISTSEILIKTNYSSINFKDALAVTGRGAILKKFPLIAGIDVSGQIAQSKDKRFKEGDRVLICGGGLGENIDGAYASHVLAPADWAIPIPNTLTEQEVMIIGTAGFTAAICLLRMQQNGQSPDKGPIVVTGASGGVGMMAVSLFSKAGYEVIALSSKSEQYNFLKKIGATEASTVEALNLGNRPLESARFGGVVDNIGGPTLAKLAAATNLWGNISCVGLADSHELSTTVMPLILRGVSFLGASSSNCPQAMRLDIWQKLANDWKLDALPKICSAELSLKEIPDHAQAMLERKSYGRAIVKI